MEYLFALILMLIALYPLILIWRFLRLGIKAFKKYLSEKPVNYYFEQPNYESDDE